jgi:hypothetical protein
MKRSDTNKRREGSGFSDSRLSSGDFGNFSLLYPQLYYVLLIAHFCKLSFLVKKKVKTHKKIIEKEK